jgi:hypothetical protein
VVGVSVPSRRPQHQGPPMASPSTLAGSTRKTIRGVLPAGVQQEAVGDVSEEAVFSITFSWRPCTWRTTPHLTTSTRR